MLISSIQRRGKNVNEDHAGNSDILGTFQHCGDTDKTVSSALPQIDALALALVTYTPTDET